LGSGGAIGSMARLKTPSGSRQIDGGSAGAAAGASAFSSAVRLRRTAGKSTSSPIACTSSYWAAALRARKANQGAVAKTAAKTKIASTIRSQIRF
jgi:hypothetical protein